MTRKRVTASEKKQRHAWAIRQIDKGVGFSELATLVAETWGCSRRQARRVVADAHKEWMEIAFGAEEIDQRDLLMQTSSAWSALRVRRKKAASSQWWLAASPSSTK